MQEEVVLRERVKEINQKNSQKFKSKLSSPITKEAGIKVEEIPDLSTIAKG